ncbi:MAG: 5'/3'-nucleotidase SurE [Candidatus Puniceispirillales bacterium]
MMGFSEGRVGRILISNDDGIDAEGLVVLEELAHQLADEVWVIAPDSNCSGYGRSLTLGRDLHLTRHGERRYTVDGTPTDCIIMAANMLMKDTPPDLVLSGVNFGMNVADDITCSGTIGAAWEATVHRIPSIALSQKYDKSNPLELKESFEASRAYGVSVIRQLLDRGWAENVVMNVNFPSVAPDQVKGIKAVTVGRHKQSDDVQTGAGENQYRIGLMRLSDDLDINTDVGALLEGYITVCPLSLDMTDRATLHDYDMLTV